MVLTPQVKAQDKINAFSFFFMGGSSNAYHAFEWLKSNMIAVRAA